MIFHEFLYDYGYTSGVLNCMQLHLQTLRGRAGVARRRRESFRATHTCPWCPWRVCDTFGKFSFSTEIGIFHDFSWFLLFSQVFHTFARGVSPLPARTMRSPDLERESRVDTNTWESLQKHPTHVQDAHRAPGNHQEWSLECKSDPIEKIRNPQNYVHFKKKPTFWSSSFVTGLTCSPSR